jgi:hypothetical protein
MCSLKKEKIFQNKKHKTKIFIVSYQIFRFETKSLV